MNETPERIRGQVRERFSRIARDPSTESRFPVGAESAKKLGYPPEQVDALPAECTARFAGVGCPLSLGPLPEGATVLDVGAGSGLDSFLAARRVGSTGRVVGIDMTREMVELAEAVRGRMGLSQIEFHLGDADNTPLDSETVDVALSNGVLNLCVEKEPVLREIYRTLRPGGVLYLADILLEDGVDQATVYELGTWSD